MATACSSALDAVGYAFEKKISYSQMYDSVVMITSFLCEKGIKQGDRVAILSENSPFWGIAYFAIIRTGATVVPILPDFLKEDVHHILSDSKVKCVFISLAQGEKLNGYENITNIQTMFDSGRHSGRLRDERGVLPPGDLRQGILALADDGLEQELRDLLTFRFPEKGTSSLNHATVGNILLTALAETTGSLIGAIEVMCKLFRVRGQVL